MKTKITFFILLFSAAFANAADHVYCDFETKDLNFATNDALTYAVIANPVSGGVNTSAHCAKVVSAGGQWELIYSASMDEFIDFDESKVFKMKVYSPRVGVPIYFKVEGGAEPKEVTSVTTTKANEWEELTFDFTDLAPQSMTYNKFVLIFDAGQEGSGETFYFDDIIGPNTITVVIPETTFVPYCNFEDVTLKFVQANTENDMQYDVVVNPDKSGINTSDSCGKIVTTADYWELLVSDPVSSPFNFAEYGYKFKMKVYAPASGDVFFKVETEDGSANKEVQLYCPVANQWYEMEYDFAELLPASNVMSKIILLFDANSDYAGDVWYFDDIQGPGDTSSTGIFDVGYKNVSDLIYPNPVHDAINFKETLQNKLVEIISVTGVKVFSEKVSGNSIDISNLGLANGLYIITIDDKTSRLLKQ
jgi:hypothetical protein